MNNEKYYFGIRKFDGNDKRYTVSKWISVVEESAEYCGWTPLQTLLIARGSLTGTAALWLRCEDVVYKTWNELKIAIAKEFSEELDLKSIHETMSRRCKQNAETFLEYVFTMRILGELGKMPDIVAIQYIVNGINDAECYKSTLRTCTTYDDLKQKLKDYEAMKQKMRYEDVPLTVPTEKSQTIKINEDHRQIPTQTNEGDFFNVLEKDVTSGKNETKDPKVITKCAEENCAEEECAADSTIDNAKKLLIGLVTKMVIDDRYLSNECYDKQVNNCFDKMSTQSKQIQLLGKPTNIVNFIEKGTTTGKVNDDSHDDKRKRGYKDNVHTRMMRKNENTIKIRLYAQNTRVTMKDTEIYDPKKRKKKNFTFFDERIYDYKKRKKTYDS